MYVDGQSLLYKLLTKIQLANTKPHSIATTAQTLESSGPAKSNKGNASTLVDCPELMGKPRSMPRCKLYSKVSR